MCAFSMLRNIKSNLLFFDSDTKRSKYFHDCHADQCAHNGNSDGDNDTDDLSGKKMEVTKHQAVPLSDTVDGGLAKQTCRDTSPDTADTVASEGIQSVIDFSVSSLQELRQSSRSGLPGYQ